MTVSSAELERLRTAFAALAEGAPGCDDPPSPDRIWQAVRGELTPEETRKLVERTSRHPEMAEAWRLAREMVSIMGRTAEVVPMPRARRRPWLAGLAAAAVLTVGIAATLFWQAPWQRTPIFRSPGEATISSVLPEDRPLARDAFLLRWAGGPEGSEYDLFVSTSDLRVLTRAEQLTSPSHLVPEEVLADLASGELVLWRIEATAPDGRRLSSPTFVQRLQ